MHVVFAAASRTMTDSAAPALSAVDRRRLVVVALARAVTPLIALIALYYLAPLDHLHGGWAAFALVVGLLAAVGVAVYEVRAILRASYPAIRAIQALATTAPLFLLLFATAYYLMAQAGHNFNVETLTRTDALYFTVTVFATVGFGDITAVSQHARLLVTVQMLLDLLILGLGVRVFLGAVQVARDSRASSQRDG